MLSTEGLEHFYARRCVLQLDRLELDPGSVTAVVGPNGSGKSTLLRILACLEPPSRGRLTWQGRPIHTRADRHAARRAITLVEQHPLLFRGTARENLVHALALHGVRGADADRRSAEAIELLGIGELAEREARDLSEGETQKVAIARALALQPAVLLLDEPASAADPRSALRLYQVFEDERRKGTAICFASHQVEDAYRWANRLLALTEGRASPVTPENHFRTVIPETGAGPCNVRAGPLELQIVTDRTGPATVAIPPDDILVSAAPLRSSARNQFSGRVTRISEDTRGGVTLRVDVGTELTVRVTRAALEELGLTLGSPVVLTVKAMAVRVF
jgi:tungstate transport system ATP-binding protein